MYGPHKVRGKWKIYAGPVEEMIVQKDRTGDDTKAALVQGEDQEEVGKKRLPYSEARLKVCLRGQEMEIQRQLVPEQEAQEQEGEEVSFEKKNKKKK